MTLGRKFELVEKALYDRPPEEVIISSYSISEQKVFYMKRRELLEEHSLLLRQIQDLGADYDPLNSVCPFSNVTIGFGKAK